MDDGLLVFLTMGSDLTDLTPPDRLRHVYGKYTLSGTSDSRKSTAEGFPGRNLSGSDAACGVLVSLMRLRSDEGRYKKTEDSKQTVLTNPDAVRAESILSLPKHHA